MQLREARRRKRALALLSRPGVAAAVAEALIAHDHPCYARLAAEHLLEMLGLTEVEFLVNWSAGDYGG